MELLQWAYVLCTSGRLCVNKVSLPTGNARAMGTSAADFQHHQVRAEEEPPGSAGCVGVLQLQEDLQQPEVHEFHRYMVMVSCICFVQLSMVRACEVSFV